MAPSPNFVVKMKNLVGLILGLLAAVHSTPVNTVTPAKAGSDVFQEVMEDEFLIPSLTTPVPKRNPNFQTSWPPSTDFKTGEMVERSYSRDATATQSVSKALSAISTMRDTSDSPSDPFSTQGYQSTEKNREKMAHYADSTSDFGSGNDEIQVQYPATITNMTSRLRKGASTALSTSTAPPVTTEDEDSYSGSGMAEDFTQSTTAANANAQNVLMAQPHSTSSSGDRRHTLGHYPATVSSTSTSPRKEASNALSTSTVPTSATGNDDSGSGSGMSGEFTELTTATTITTYTMSTVSTGQPNSTLGSDVKSRRGAIQDQIPVTASSMTSAAAPPVSIEREVVLKKSNPAKTSIEFTNGYKDERRGSNDSGHKTPGWIVVLACIVGVAALVIVGAAIVTRERWYGPSQVSQLESKTSQQRELEMETFLYQDKPRETGNAEQYSVIPLDETPQNHTSL